MASLLTEKEQLPALEGLHKPFSMQLLFDLFEQTEDIFVAKQYVERLLRKNFIEYPKNLRNGIAIEADIGSPVIFLF
jgi:hypothetical protein